MPRKDSGQRRPGHGRGGASSRRDDIRSTSRANAGSPQRPASRGWSRRWRRTRWASSGRTRCDAGPIDRTGQPRDDRHERTMAAPHQRPCIGSSTSRNATPGRGQMGRSPAAYHDGGSHRSSPRGASSPDTQPEGSVSVDGVTAMLVFVVAPGGRVRLHQRIPRHGQRDRHVRRDAGAVARPGDPHGDRVQLHRRVRRDGRRQDHRQRPRRRRRRRPRRSSPRRSSARSPGTSSPGSRGCRARAATRSSAACSARRSSRAGVGALNIHGHRQQGPDPDVHLAAPRLRRSPSLFMLAHLLDLPKLASASRWPAASGGCRSARPRSWPSPTARTMPRRRWASSPWPCSRPASSRRSTCRLGHHRVGDGAVARDRRRWLADHADDGPARRRSSSRSTASRPRRPRPRSCSDGPLRDAGLDHPGHLERDHGRRREPGRPARPLGRRPAHPLAWILTIPAAGILAALAWVVLNALGVR